MKWWLQWWGKTISGWWDPGIGFLSRCTLSAIFLHWRAASWNKYFDILCFPHLVTFVHQKGLQFFLFYVNSEIIKCCKTCLCNVSIVSNVSNQRNNEFSRCPPSVAAMARAAQVQMLELPWFVFTAWLSGAAILILKFDTLFKQDIISSFGW